MLQALGIYVIVVAIMADVTTIKLPFANAELFHILAAEHPDFLAEAGEPMTQVIVRLRRDAAATLRSERGMQGGSGAADVRTVLQRFGVDLYPQHPGVNEAELGSYFVIRTASPAEAERIAAALRALDAVEAAYVQPVPTPP